MERSSEAQSSATWCTPLKRMRPGSRGEWGAGVCALLPLQAGVGVMWQGAHARARAPPHGSSPAVAAQAAPPPPPAPREATTRRAAPAPPPLLPRAPLGGVLIAVRCRPSRSTTADSLERRRAVDTLQVTTHRRAGACLMQGRGGRKLKLAFELRGGRREPHSGAPGAGAQEEGGGWQGAVGGRLLLHRPGLAVGRGGGGGTGRAGERGKGLSRRLLRALRLRLLPRRWPHVPPARCRALGGGAAAP